MITMPRTRYVVPLLLAACATAPAPVTPVEPPPAPIVRAPPSPPPVLLPKVAPLALPPTAWPAEKQALHALNRMAYGPSPDDLAAIHEQGLATWMAFQLQPELIRDDAVERKLAGFKSLTLTTAELEAAFPPPQQIAKREGLDAKDPEAMREMREMIPPKDLPREVVVELISQKLIRATESRRQLEEVLTDFWFNHFNVSADKGPCRFMLTSYERDAIRAHLFGSFRELLGATAHHPAMLFYLDNWTSTREGFDPPGKQAAKNGRTGLNENYGRELLELHTLGVEGGYTQQDVREVARAFTGWSIDRPQKVGAYVFRDRPHDKDAKQVLGLQIPPGGGESDGEAVLDLLAAHPSTARFIASKLCRKFVSDDPPQALVARVADVFQATQGNLRAVYEAIFTSPEFWSDPAYAAKVKTPLELVVSAVRAVGGTTDGDIRLAQRIGAMGQPLYRAQPPTGYPEVAEPWVNAGALVSRINFGLAMVSGRLPGVEIDVRGLTSGPVGDADAAIDLAGQHILHERVAPATRQTILHALDRDEEHLADGERRPVDVRMVAGLLLGSPQFQKQ
jgi:uncharacterized protein (DUF1800 family)